MPWLASLLAALELLHIVHASGNHFASFDELAAGLRNQHKRCPNRFLGTRDCTEPEVAVDDDTDTSKMLNALFGFTPSTPATVPAVAPTVSHANEASSLNPYQLPAMYYNDFYEDLLTTKRNDIHAAGCDCKVMNDLIDLGSNSFPRYLMKAVCESQAAMDAKCSLGSNCKPLEYKVKVLTLSSDTATSRLWLPEDTPPAWKFKTVTVTAGCFCTN